MMAHLTPLLQQMVCHSQFHHLGTYVPGSISSVQCQKSFPHGTRTSQRTLIEANVFLLRKSQDLGCDWSCTLRLLQCSCLWRVLLFASDVRCVAVVTTDMDTLARL